MAANSQSAGDETDSDQTSNALRPEPSEPSCGRVAPPPPPPTSVADPAVDAINPSRSSDHKTALSPRMDGDPSSPTATATKLSTPPPLGFSSPPHHHHQPPTMLSPVGDHPPLKLRLSINKVFQAKLEGTASSTSINSSDGEQSGAESESVRQLCFIVCPL